jgi:hypothetical protein
MRVLVACEFSGVVREAFAARGHDAWSCDLLPSELPGQHYQCDVRDVLGLGWDLMIAHPPCTYLSRAANRVWNTPGRAELREEALEFFVSLYNAPIARIAVENPVGFPNSAFRKPDQIIEPFYFGDPDRKRTCLWLKNLHPLIHWSSDTLFGKRTWCDPPSPAWVSLDGKRRMYFTAFNAGNWKERSRTFPGIAAAMAAQWG